MDSIPTIEITSNSVDALAKVQRIIETGLLNIRDENGTKFNASYSLTNGNRLLVNKYNNLIIGERDKKGNDIFIDDKENK